MGLSLIILSWKSMLTKPILNDQEIKIDLLKNHSSAIPTLAHIWHEVLGKIWMPEIGIEEIKTLYYEELNQE